MKEAILRPDGSNSRAILPNMLKLTNSVTHSTTTDVPLKTFVTLQSAGTGIQTTAIKEDGYNRNVMSKNFVGINFHLLNIKKTRSIISHSDRNRTETWNESTIEADVELGPH